MLGAVPVLVASGALAVSDFPVGKCIVLFFSLWILSGWLEALGFCISSLIKAVKNALSKRKGGKRL